MRSDDSGFARQKPSANQPVTVRQHLLREARRAATGAASRAAGRLASERRNGVSLDAAERSRRLGIESGCGSGLTGRPPWCTIVARGNSMGPFELTASERNRKWPRPFLRSWMCDCLQAARVDGVTLRRMDRSASTHPTPLAEGHSRHLRTWRWEAEPYAGCPW